MIRKWLWLLVDTQKHMQVGGEVLKMQERATNTPARTRLNGKGRKAGGINKGNPVVVTPKIGSLLCTSKQKNTIQKGRVIFLLLITVSI